MRPAHGRATSSCAASWNSVASSPNGAMTCTPIGSPAAFQCSGTLIAGSPVWFATWVFGVFSSAFAPSVASSLSRTNRGETTRSAASAARSAGLSASSPILIGG